VKRASNLANTGEFSNSSQPLSSNRKTEKIGTYALMNKNFASVLGVQARFSTTQQLFTNSSDPKKQTCCIFV